MMLELFLLALLGVASAKDSYVVVSPTTIRPGMDFQVSVNILKASSGVNVKATIVKGRQSVASASGTVRQDQPQGITLKVPGNLKNGTYKLRVAGSGGLSFKNETTLFYSSKGMSIFIQTDKAMYKAGQTVHFRAFAMFPDMKLYTGAMDVDIFDPKSNKVKQWVGLQDASGVITNYLPTASQPVFGDWKIKVTVGKESKEKVFTIAEYVLPKFDVTVELPPFGTESDNDITATIKAKYTYGKPVKGRVNLVARLSGFYRPRSRDGDEPVVKKTVEIDGETKVTVPLTVMKKAFPYRNGLSGREIQVTANVTEDLTGITMNGSSKLRMYVDAVKLSFSPSDPTVFKPGLQYKAYLQVQQQDGRPAPVSNQQLRVSIRVLAEIKEATTPMYYSPRTTSFNLPDEIFSVPESGLVPVEINIPSNATRVTLEAWYGPLTAYKSLEKSYSPSDNYIQLILQSQQLSAGNDAVFAVRATEPISELVYQILSRGSIVATGNVDANQQTDFTFAIPVTPPMAPNARIIVYYVREDGEIVTDSVSYDVEGAFQNKVSITMDKTSAQPGDSVNVQVTADPQSLVNLLAVDQSVLLLKSGNDITQSEVISELKSYNSINKGIIDFYPRRRGRRSILPWGLPTYYGGSDATEVFENSGVAVMTDALVYRHPGYYGCRYCGYGIGGGNGARGGGFGRRGTQREAPAFAGQSAGITSGGELKEVERIRTEFPETWLWQNQTVSTDGKAVISTTVPDTITSWVASAFAVNSQSGLGIAPTSAKIRVFRPFFVSLNLPYSVTRGEQLALQAIVFNYLDQDVDAVVTLPKSAEYGNVVVRGNRRERTESEDQSQTVKVKAGGATSVYFPIVPTTLGKIDLAVSARSTVAADAVKRQLLVEPEGTPKEYNVPVLIDLKEATTFSKSVPITLPENVVPGSLRARVTAVGDLMGPTVNGLDSLLRMPTGCGEQTMVGLAPDVFITNYLTATNQLTGDIEEKAIKYMESGYQRELTYQHKDGSFSAFGDRDPSGSMWLTAFVVKTFHQAKPYTFIDDEVLTKAIDWMIGRQKADGSFPEPGHVLSKSMAGGAGKGAPLTAYVLIALLENNDLPRDVQKRIRDATKKAVRFLEKQTPTDDYALAIMTYALQLAGSSKANDLFDTLNSHAIEKDGMKHWHRPDTTLTTSRRYWTPPSLKNAIDIEMTSYALLTFAERDDYSGGLSIMKWLASQRNPHGGFSSTQDTVIALQALSEFAKMAYSDSFDIQVNVNSGIFSHQFSVNQNNALVLQDVELPSVPDSVSIEATGNGIALVEVAVFFNVEAEVEEPSFDLTVKLLKEDINSITVQTCTKWLLNGTSGMAIQELGVPSGFEADLDTLTKLSTLKRVETENKKVVLYFDEIGTTPVCLSVTLQRTGLVAKSQPVPVRVYDYYEPTNQVTTFYQSKVLKNSSICRVCVECENCVARRGR